MQPRLGKGRERIVVIQRLRPFCTDLGHVYQVNQASSLQQAHRRRRVNPLLYTIRPVGTPVAGAM